MISQTILEIYFNEMELCLTDPLRPRLSEETKMKVLALHVGIQHNITLLCQRRDIEVIQKEIQSKQRDFDILKRLDQAFIQASQNATPFLE